MPISTSLRKLLCCAPVRQEEEAQERPPRRPLPEPVEAAPAQPGRPHREYVENEADRFRQEMAAAGLPLPGRPYPEHAGNGVDRMFQELIDDLENLAEIKKIPLPEHPQPHHPPIHFTTDPESGRPIPDEDALLRGDYVYVPESGSRITREEFIPPWRNPGVFPTENDLMSRGWDACYSLHGEGAGMRLMYHWLSGLPGEPGINTRVDRLFSPAASTMHFSPHPPARAEMPAMQPVPEPARQPADDAGSRRREIPLPDHPVPKHPPVYYTLDPASGRPIPEEDSLISGDYLRRQSDGRHVLPQGDITPWRQLGEPDRRDFFKTPEGPIAYYSLESDDSGIHVILHIFVNGERPGVTRRRLNDYLFTSLHEEHFGRRQRVDDAYSRLREIPLPDHDGPQHVRVYYRLDRETGVPVPDIFSVIHGRFLPSNIPGFYKSCHGYLVEDIYHPWRQLRSPSKVLLYNEYRSFYSLVLYEGEIRVRLHRIIRRAFRSPRLTWSWLPNHGFRYRRPGIIVLTCQLLFCW